MNFDDLVRVLKLPRIKEKIDEHQGGERGIQAAATNEERVA